MKKILFSLLLVAFVLNTQAIVRPGSLFNDGMVLQQQSDVLVWGRAKANTTVTAKASWDNKTVKCKSDAQGCWKLKLRTPKASYQNYELMLSDGDKLKIKNILIGEVWLASGQSNMEMPVKGFPSCPTENSNAFIAQADSYKGRIRVATIPRFPLRQPGDYVEGLWEDCTPENVADFTACGYFFALEITNKLNCPVGIINSSWGGTRVEGWTPQDLLEQYGEKMDNDVFRRPNEGTPMVMYNGMIKPLAGYTIKGFLWYQGESNVSYPQQYAERFSNMIKRWRRDWDQGELPFLYVEIAPFNYNSGTRSAKLREAQCKVQHQVSNCWMVCTNDLVYDFERVNIHPCKKFDVGQRLSWLALDKIYGLKGIISQSPEFQSMEIEDGKALISLSNMYRGYNRFVDIQGFEIAGADKKFYPAQVGFEKGCVAISSPDVKEPVAVRYCFKDFEVGNFGNGANLPLVPFRTDDWEE